MSRMWFDKRDLPAGVFLLGRGDRAAQDRHDGGLRDKSDCHFRKTATDYDRKPGIKWLGCAVK